MDKALHHNFGIKGRRYLVDFFGSSYPSHIVSGTLCLVACGIVWSMVPHKTMLSVASRSGTPTPQENAVAIAQQIASSHLFGQDPALASSTITRPASDIKVEGVIYSDDKDSALVVLNIDGKSDIFRVGDSLPDGEKVLALAPTAVQLGSPGSPRVIEMQAQFGDGGSAVLAAAGGADITGRGPSSFPGMAPALPRPALRPVELSQNADPLSQLRSLRQQLIRQGPATSPDHPVKRPPRP